MIQLVESPKVLGPAICIICGKSEGGRVTKHKHIREAFEMKIPGNWDMCKPHKKLHQEGFIALVEALPPEDGKDEAHRTGKFIHVKYDLAEQLFKTAIDRSLPMVFCMPDISKRLEDMVRFAAKHGSLSRKAGRHKDSLGGANSR